MIVGYWRFLEDVIFMSNLWDKREDESSKNYDAFAEYLRLGINRKLEDITSYSLSHRMRLSAQFNWVDRANAYDVSITTDSLAKLKKSQENAYIKFTNDQINMANEFNKGLIEDIKSLNNVEDDDFINSNLLTMKKDVSVILGKTAETQRLITGRPTIVTESEENININNNEVSDEKAKIFKEAMETTIENKVKLRLEEERNKTVDFEDDDG
jgi:hypothetical protein